MYENTSEWRICRETHYLGDDFYLGLLELRGWFGVLLLTTKVEFSLFA